MQWIDSKKSDETLIKRKNLHKINDLPKHERPAYNLFYSKQYGKQKIYKY